MCGIAGELALTEHPSYADWEHLRDMMARRGPDDKGLWLAEDGRCTLAFRRLAVLDLTSNSAQPMVDPSGRYVLVFNGEIYNFRELRATLAARGVSFRSSGDSEVLLHALITWGTDALNRLNGMFAAALYDNVEKKLLLARDHAGIKPLYYLQHRRGIVFASQYNQLLAHPWSGDCLVSMEALGIFLRLGYIQAPYALLENTYMLPAGTWISFNAEGESVQNQYYSFPERSEPTLCGQEAVEAVDEAVTNAVRRQLVSDVPVGTFLSGGIDSPLVAAKMQAVSDDPILAFTIGTGGGPHDEAPDAAIYAREIGVHHHVEHFSPEIAVEMVDDVIIATGEPFADYAIFPTMLVSQLARQKVTVMLSGDGGDELFWGYPERFGSVLNEARRFREPYWLRSARWMLQKWFDIGDITWNVRWPSIGRWYREKHTHLQNHWLKRIAPTAPDWPEMGLFEYEGWRQDRTAQWLRWNEMNGHLSRVLLKVDRASMHYSLEVRVPLLDREVIDVASRIEWQTCLDLEAQRGKIPLRHSLARHTGHQTDAKRGFMVPMSSWLRDELRSRFEETVIMRQEILGLPLDRDALQAFYNLHLSGEADFGWGLWLLLSLALWEDRYYRQRSTGRLDVRDIYGTN